MSDAATPENRVLIAVATYNERQTLPSLIDAIFTHAPFIHLLVIDDASPDGTGKYCDERAANDSRIKVLHRAGKLGLGTAILASFQYAIEHDYDLLVSLDADWSHPPEKIPDLIARVEGTDGQGGCDIAVASRYAPGGGIQGWPLRRRIASGLVNRFATLILGLPVRDCSGAFRCFRVSALRRVLENGLEARGYAIFEEVLLRLAENGARFSEVPYVFVDRTQGKSKLTLKETLRAITALLSLALGRFMRSRRRSSASQRRSP